MTLRIWDASPAGEGRTLLDPDNVLLSELPCSNRVHGWVWHCADSLSFLEADPRGARGGGRASAAPRLPICPVPHIPTQSFIQGDCELTSRHRSSSLAPALVCRAFMFFCVIFFLELAVTRNTLHNTCRRSVFFWERLILHLAFNISTSHVAPNSLYLSLFHFFLHPSS